MQGSAKRSVLDLAPQELSGKVALVRVDLNVPTEGARVTDDTRIREAVPTIKHLLRSDARVLLASHLVRAHLAACGRCGLLHEAAV